MPKSETLSSKTHFATTRKYIAYAVLAIGFITFVLYCGWWLWKRVRRRLRRRQRNGLMPADLELQYLNSSVDEPLMLSTERSSEEIDEQRQSSICKEIQLGDETLLPGGSTGARDLEDLFKLRIDEEDDTLCDITTLSPSPLETDPTPLSTPTEGQLSESTSLQSERVSSPPRPSSSTTERQYLVSSPPRSNSSRERQYLSKRVTSPSRRSISMVQQYLSERGSSPPIPSSLTERERVTSPPRRRNSLVQQYLSERVSSPPGPSSSTDRQHLISRLPRPISSTEWQYLPARVSSPSQWYGNTYRREYRVHSDRAVQGNGNTHWTQSRHQKVIQLSQKRSLTDGEKSLVGSFSSCQ